jgi:hypothetical protein
VAAPVKHRRFAPGFRAGGSGGVEFRKRAAL